MNRTIGENSFLSKTLDDLHEAALQIFFDILDAQGKSSLRFLHPPEANLSVPISIVNSALNLRELMMVYETSLLGDEDELQKVDDFRRILSVSVEPSLEACQKMVDLNSSKDASKDEWANHVFLLNCFAYIQENLLPFSFAKEKTDQLSGLLETHVNQLTELHYRYLLKDSGLSNIVATIEIYDGNNPLSLTEAGSPDSIAKALSKFADFLKGLDVVSSPRLLLLSAPRLSDVIHQDSLRKICFAYGSVCEAVQNRDNKYEFAGTLLGSHRPFGQMSTLRQLLGITQED